MTVTPIKAPKKGTLLKPPLEQFVEAWPWVRQGLLKVKEATDGAQWIPEQVRRQIELGYAGQNGCEFWLYCDDRDVMGFYVTVAQVDPWVGVVANWLLWIGYSDQGGMMAGSLEHLLGVARQRGYLAVDVVTSQGWILEKLKKYGFSPLQVTARRKMI